MPIFVNKQGAIIAQVPCSKINPSQYDLIHWKNDKMKNLINENDMVVTIGDLREHDFAQLIVDSETQEVIGYFPIK